MVPVSHLARSPGLATGSFLAVQYLSAIQRKSTPEEIIVRAVVFSATLASLMAAGVVTQAHAQADAAQGYPNKPVRILLGFPPGQATDLLARAVAAELTKTLGQNFVVENRPGAAGIIATEMAAKATPDGYTLLATSSGPLAVNPSLYRKLPYNVSRDLALVSGLGIVPYAVIVHPSSPIKSMQDLIAAAKANPGKLNYASGGSGVTNHLATESFKLAAGIDMQHVPYKGGPAGVADVVGGRMDVMFETMAGTLPLIRDGRLRAIAVSSAQRASALPNIPTISESGVPGFSAVPWVAMAAPAKVPQAIINKLNVEINKILKGSEVKARFAALGTEPMVMTPAELNAFLKSETQKWAQAVKASGAKVD
jgi:tripartite-type tricarboxylate transporter receptor subunit TctC